MVGLLGLSGTIRLGELAGKVILVLKQTVQTMIPNLLDYNFLNPQPASNTFGGQL